MQESERDILQHADRLLQHGKKHEARQLLIAYIRRTPDSVQAWWLLSHAVTEEKQQTDCLERVLRLDPGNAAAKTRLQKLQRSQEPFDSPEWLSRIAQTPEDTPPGNGPEFAPAAPFAPGLLADDPDPLPVSERESSRGSSKRLFSTSAELKKNPSAGKKKAGFLQMALIAVVICVGVAGIGYVGMLVLGQKMALDMQATQVMAQAWTRNPPQTLPPTWTMTSTLTALPSRTPTPTPTPSPTFLISILYTDTKAPAGLRSQPISTGPLAPDFTLKDVHTEEKVSLSDYRGRPVILVFWVTWCGYCKREMSSLNSVYKTYRGDGLVVLAINVGESASNVRSYRKSNGLTFAVLLDSTKSTAQSYNVTGYPRNVFIDRNGKIDSMVAGMMSTGQLTSRVKEILAE